jgi:hypothetical protein
LKRHLVVQGRLTSGTGPSDCKAFVPVKIQRRRVDGTWSTVATDNTDSAGFFSKRIPDTTGRYRARVVMLQMSETERCAVATSPTRRHSH